MRLISVIVALLVVLCLTGCISPPEGTVLLDLDGDGKIDALGRDSNGDGKVDVNEAGEPLIVAGSEGYRIASGVDLIAPEILMWAGGAIGVPVLVGIGAAWKGSKFGRIFMNTVMSVQSARQRLKDKGNISALAIVDEALGGQAAETVREIAKVKEKLNLSSVSDSRKSG